MNNLRVNTDDIVFMDEISIESELFFDTFKKFCLDEFQAMNYKVMTFEELIEEVKEELNLK